MSHRAGRRRSIKQGRRSSRNRRSVHYNQIDDVKYPNHDDDTESIISTSTMIKNTSNFDLHGSYDFDSVQYGSRIAGNPKIWQWKQVKTWLNNKDLKVMIEIFKRDNDNSGIDGEELLGVDMDRLFSELDAEEILKVSRDKAPNHPTIIKFFRFCCVYI